MSVLLHPDMVTSWLLGGLGFYGWHVALWVTDPERRREREYGTFR